MRKKRFIPSFFFLLLLSELYMIIPLRSDNLQDKLFVPPEILILSPLSVKTGLGGKASFVAAAPKPWNDLPYDIKINSDFTSFKQKLKTILFNQAYE